MKISVITINWNMAESLKKTFKSIHAQSYPNIEHIVIDGSSSDNSILIAGKLIRKNDLFITEKDNGISDAFNKGISHATGDYLCFMNSGDVFASSDVITNFVEFIATNQLSAVYYGDFLTDTKGRIRLEKASANAADFEWSNPINHQSCFIPLDLARNFLYDERLKLGMDYDFWLRVLSKTDFIKLPFPVAIFELSGRCCDPLWRVHNTVVRRILWHINNGTRIEWLDVFKIFKKTTFIKLKMYIKAIYTRK